VQAQASNALTGYIQHVRSGSELDISAPDGQWKPFGNTLDAAKDKKAKTLLKQGVLAFFSDYLWCPGRASANNGFTWLFRVLCVIYV